jgi:hypothetical protein
MEQSALSFSPLPELITSSSMTVEEVVWPNDAGFDTDYQEPEPVELKVKGTIPSYAAGVLCENLHTKAESKIMLTAL